MKRAVSLSTRIVMIAYSYRGIMRFLSVIIVVLSTVTICSAKKTDRHQVDFSETELETASPHDTEMQKRVLEDVLKIMRVNKRKPQTPPLVFKSESITDEESDYAQAAVSQGIPFWALEKGINIYLIDHNVILLGSKMKLHNLAHEYAHFVQVKHFRNTREDFRMDDHLESNAVSVQNYFRD